MDVRMEVAMRVSMRVRVNSGVGRMCVCNVLGWQWRGNRTWMWVRSSELPLCCELPIMRG